MIIVLILLFTFTLTLFRFVQQLWLSQIITIKANNHDQVIIGPRCVNSNIYFNTIYINRNTYILYVRACAVPAEVQQRPCGGGYALCRPAQEVELSEGTSFLGLNVLQVETPHQEVITPDMLRHQVHLSEIIKGEHNI